MSAEYSLQQQVHLLYRDHHGWLYSWLRRRLGNAADAADLAHDTYLRVVVRGFAPQADESRQHLTQIAKGLLVDLFRRRELERAYLDAVALLPVQNVPSLEERTLIIEALLEIDGVLRKLPAKARTALLLCKLDGLSYREIAERLNVSVSSVEKYIARALLSCYEVMCRDGTDR